MAADFFEFQLEFHRRWGELQDPHVRALAWLIDAPDLLDTASPRWQGKLASLGNHADTEWLHALDRQPAALHAFINTQPVVRLGRYAEKLLAWYFMQKKTLHLHGLQVRDPATGTLGEFDFLLRLPNGLEHWELATKFYLLRPTPAGAAAPDQWVNRPDYFIGPNLADTLGAKMQKIFGRQLALGEHPAARALIDEPLVAAKALVKGWLFYRRDDPREAQTFGVSPAHCLGWWCRIDELHDHLPAASAILPRLSWLAPARRERAEFTSFAEANARLRQLLSTNDMPLMVANLVQNDDAWIETDRGFVVPSDWEERAEQRANDATAVT